MSLGLCLVLTSAALGLGAPYLLARLRLRATPRSGVILWLLTLGGALLAWLAATAVLAVDAAILLRHSGHAASACLGLLSCPAAGGLPRLVVVAAAAVTTLAAAYQAGRAVRRWRREWSDLRRRRRSVNLAGYDAPDLGDGVMVLDDPRRVIYCLPGGIIVVTTGAQEGLSTQELAAALAHERGHLFGHHHLALAVVRGARLLPLPTPVFDSAHRLVGELLEMCADDHAARRHQPRTLVAAMLAMCGGSVPQQALGAADTAVLARASRLMTTSPPGRVARLAHLRITATAAAAVTAVGFLPMAVVCPLLA